MTRKTSHPHIKSLFWSLTAGFFFVSLVTGSIMGSRAASDRKAREFVQELHRIDLLSRLSPKTVTDLIDYQSQTGYTLAKILQDPVWCTRLGMNSEQFKVTWYMSNPFDLLPADLQRAISQHPVQFTGSRQLFDWAKARNGSGEWKRALYQALIETTAQNLWRAGQGMRPYCKNGEFIEPIVVDFGKGRFEVRDGHIATDPRVIPTNSTVLLLVTVNGEERVLKVKAADIGCGIKGKHVDLPIHLNNSVRVTLPHTLFPKEVSNPSVRILTPIELVANPGQKV